jgi:predicted metal-binding membrane protein
VRLGSILAVAVRGPGKGLLAVSLSGWLASLLWGHTLFAPEYCSAMADLLERTWRAMDMALLVNAPGALLLAWLTMLLATMTPLLARPLAHLWHRTFADRRLRAALLFLTGYTAVWMAAGIVLMSAAILLKVLIGPTSLGPIAAVVTAALWQMTPAKQVCLNRCHHLPPLSAFGLAADRDALTYGLASGWWCVGACWAVMLVPLLAEKAHLALMALAAVLLLAERQAPARSVHWRLPIHTFAR